MTLAARASHREEALLVAQLAATLALRARRGFRPLRGARAGTGLARFVTGNLERRLGAARRFFEGDLEVVAQVGPALRTAAALTKGF